MATSSQEAYVSLTTNDQYGAGAYVLGKSLKKTGTQRRLVLLVTSGVSEGFRKKLSSVWDELIEVSELDSMDKANLVLLKRPELGCTFSKLRAWTLTQFKKCVFLDADTLVVQNVDDLFQREELSASPDIGWPDNFNTGVFVFVPSMKTYEALLRHAEQHGSYDGGDQGLLNDFFSSWATKDISTHLPFTYNMVSNVCYSYAPAYRRYGSDVKIIHFLGSVKPWHHTFNPNTRSVSFLPSARYSGADHKFIQMWWNTYSEGNGTESGPFGNAEGSAHAPSGESPSWNGGQTRASWEQGLMDYTGRDNFDSIMNYMKSLMMKEKEKEIAEKQSDIHY